MRDMLFCVFLFLALGLLMPYRFSLRFANEAEEKSFTRNFMREETVCRCLTFELRGDLSFGENVQSHRLRSESIDEESQIVFVLKRIEGTGAVCQETSWL